MPEETQTLEPAAAPAQPQGESAPSTGGVSPDANGNGQPQAAQAPTTNQPAQPQGNNGKPVWDGKIENLPNVGANEVERGKAMERYLTKRTQELAETQKKAEQFDRMLQDPSYGQYQQWLHNQQTLLMNQAQMNKPPLVSQQEWDDARLDADPNKFANLVNRVVESRLTQAEQYVNGKLSEIGHKQSILEHTQEIEDFASANPDFWDLYDAGILAPLVREITDTKKGTLADAYVRAKEIRERFERDAIQKSNARVNEKKAAVSAAPSASQEPGVIWADSKQEADRIAFEQAVLGKRVNVRVKK